MQTSNRKGRVNYEPNGWGKGPRAHPLEGYVSYAVRNEGEKRRLRPESFADHYSQARQFFLSQTPVEQGHIRDALVFELSKCQEIEIRARIVAHLLNIDGALAQAVADGLGLTEMPEPAPAARPTRTDLPPSDALSMLKNPPPNFAGRTVGVLAGNGVEAELLTELRSILQAEGAMMKLVAPRVGGVTDSAGTLHPADEKLGGGPSVIFDAVAVLPGSDAAMLAANPAAQDFLTDAHAHCKFIAHHGAGPLIEACALGAKMDEGWIEIGSSSDIDGFVAACRGMRHWPREATLGGNPPLARTFSP